MTVDGTRAPPRDGASCARRDRGANASADPRKYFKPLSPPVTPTRPFARAFVSSRRALPARVSARSRARPGARDVRDRARRRARPRAAGTAAPRASDPAALVSAHKLAPSAPRAPPPEDPSSGATAIVATLLEASARPLRGTAATREAALRREASAARVRALERSSARRRPPLDPVEVPRPSHRVFSRRPFVGADARANAKDEDALLARAREGRDAVSRSAAPDLLRRAARLAEEVPELPRWATLEGAAAARGFALATRVEHPIDVMRAFAAHSVAARPHSPPPPPSARRAVERLERPALAAVAATVSRTLRTKRSGDSIGFANPRRRATHASRLSAAAATFPFRSRGEGPHSRPDPFPTEALAALRRALPPERESPRASANSSGAREGSPEEAPDENMKKNPPPPSRSAAAAAAFVVLPRPVPATPPRGPRVAAVEPPTLAPRLAPFARRVPRAFAIFSSSSRRRRRRNRRRRRATTTRAAGTPRDGGPRLRSAATRATSRVEGLDTVFPGLRRRRRFRLDPRGPGGAAPARSRGSPRGGPSSPSASSRRRARRIGGRFAGARARRRRRRGFSRREG